MVSEKYLEFFFHLLLFLCKDTKKSEKRKVKREKIIIFAPMNERSKISVVINTYNAARFLREVLESVKDFDEVLICDMESTDMTLDIAREYGCKIVTFPKADHKSAEPARTFAIQSAACHWVLVVDADEIVTPQLRACLYHHIQQENAAEGLYIPRLNKFMGKTMACAYPDYQLRFLAREGTEWPEKIHSVPIINGKVGYIDKKHKELAMVHLDDSTKATLRRLDTYTDNEMARRLGKRVTYASIVFAPTFRFFKFFVLKGGFRYGVAGFVQAARQAIYKFTTLCKVYEAQHNVGK
jgi:glycosyltransferase involved in cell wall biosynthesis